MNLCASAPLRETAGPLPILTVSALRAWLIVHGHATVANQPRPTPYRGPVLIQARAGLTRETYLQEKVFCASLEGFDVTRIPPYEDFHLPEMMGGILGTADLVDCVRECFGDHKAWFAPGHYGYILLHARPLPVECGSLLPLSAPGHEQSGSKLPHSISEAA